MKKEEMVNKVTLPLIRSELSDLGWVEVTRDYPLGYIECQYAFRNDKSRLILTRNFGNEFSWDRNEWNVTLVLSVVTNSLDACEMELITGYVKALETCNEPYIKYNDLLESDIDKIDERLEYISELLAG